jgi:hypothetical protein
MKVRRAERSELSGAAWSDTSMIYDIYDIVFSVVGVLLIIFRTSYAKHVVRFWNTHFNYGYGERDVQMFKWIAVIGGVVVIGYGVRRFM